MIFFLSEYVLTTNLLIQYIYIDGPCNGTEFRCLSGTQCIPKSFHCDKSRDCQDGSDEIGCCEYRKKYLYFFLNSVLKNVFRQSLMFLENNFGRVWLYVHQ